MAMSDKVKILVVGVGNMGVSHAQAHHKLQESISLPAVELRLLKE
jgi:hypothetical protein